MGQNGLFRSETTPDVPLTTTVSPELPFSYSSMTGRDTSVCVVTQPGLSDTGPMESQTLSLCRIIEAVATVSILSLNIAEDSRLREEYEVIDAVSSGTMPESIVGAAWQFAVNQLRLGLAIRRMDVDIALFYG